MSLIKFDDGDAREIPNATAEPNDFASLMKSVFLLSAYQHHRVLVIVLRA